MVFINLFQLCSNISVPFFRSSSVRMLYLNRKIGLVNNVYLTILPPHSLQRIVHQLLQRFQPRIHRRKRHHRIIHVVAQPPSIPKPRIIVGDHDRYILGQVKRGRMVAQILHQVQHLVRNRTDLDGNVPRFYHVPNVRMFHDAKAMSNSSGVEQNRIDNIQVR
jgi:hypothetical protein